MTITIAPFTVNQLHNPIITAIEQANRLPITYWGIYLDGKYISYTSSRELAEKTKVWMEKWLRDRM